jgi:hypothetical protein
MIFYYFTFSKHELNKLNNNIACLFSSLYMYMNILRQDQMLLQNEFHKLVEFQDLNL